MTRPYKDIVNILKALDSEELVKEIAEKCDKEWCAFDGAEKIIRDYRAAIFERIGMEEP